MFISCSVFGCHSDTVPVVCLVATIRISNLFVESFYHSRLDDNYKRIFAAVPTVQSCEVSFIRRFHCT